MTAGTRNRADEPAVHLRSIPEWLSEADVAGRMVTLAYRVAHSTGRSRRECKRLWDGLVPAFAEAARAGSAKAGPGWADPGRRARSQLLTALRAELAPRVERGVLSAALQDAVLLDELALLPPRQRFALWAAAVSHQDIADISAATGWTPGQVSRLLQAALRTVAIHARI